MSTNRLLFIGLGFYDYDSAICDMLQNLGYEVDYIKSIFNQNFINKSLKKLNLDYINRNSTNKALNNSINNLKKNHDIVFVIKGENLTEQHLSQLKRDNPNARFILYLWDNLTKIKNRDILLKHFNKILSFDRQDCLSHPEFEFRPLFYLKKNEPQTTYYYYISFIGEDRPGRYEFLKNLSASFYHDKNIYIRLKASVFRTVIDRITGHKICFNSKLPYSEFCRITNESKTVLDIVEKNQSGLTMRTIEALALGKHLYTTNNEIREAPYISPKSYTILDTKNPKIEFDGQGGQSEDFYTYYGLKNFLLDILR